MKHFLPFILLLVFLGSCRKEETDDIPPQISLLSLYPQLYTMNLCGILQANVMHVAPNDLIEVKFQVSDNKMLSHYKVQLQENPQCSEVQANNSYLSLFYKVEEKVNVFAAQQEVHIRWKLTPYALPGNYIMRITAVDLQGNESVEGIEINFKVKHIIGSVNDDSTSDNTGANPLNPIKDGLAIIDARLAASTVANINMPSAFINTLQVDVRNDSLENTLNCRYIIKDADNNVLRSYLHTVNNVSGSRYAIAYPLPFFATDTLFEALKIEIQVQNRTQTDMDTHTILYQMNGN